MTIVIPHKAADAIAYFDAMGIKRMSNLVGSVPGLLQGLPVSTVSLQGDDFNIGIQDCTSAQYA